jgi:FMN phosphatase YigB (HAD superfamily)
MCFVPVFDLGNVLLGYDYELCYERVRCCCRPGARVEEVISRHLGQADLDRGGSLDQIYPWLVRDLALTMTPDEFRLAWNDIFWPLPGMFEVVEESPRPRYLLSTTNEAHVAWMHERFQPLLDLFDHCFFSCEIGLRKPDPALFRHVESYTGQAPERHLLIDDVAVNVAGAQAAGWQAFQFQGAQDCRRRLRELAER